MTDVYIEDPSEDDVRRGILGRLQGELGRMAGKLERIARNYAGGLAHSARAARDNVIDETRHLARSAKRKINANLGTSAAIALGTGLAVGLIAAAVVAHRRRGRRRGQ